LKHPVQSDVMLWVPVSSCSVHISREWWTVDEQQQWNSPTLTERQLAACLIYTWHLRLTASPLTHGSNVKFPEIDNLDQKIYFSGTRTDSIHRFERQMKAFADLTRVHGPLSTLGLYLHRDVGRW